MPRLNRPANSPALILGCRLLESERLPTTTQLTTPTTLALVGKVRMDVLTHRTLAETLRETLVSKPPTTPATQSTSSSNIHAAASHTALFPVQILVLGKRARSAITPLAPDRMTMTGPMIGTTTTTWRLNSKLRRAPNLTTILRQLQDFAHVGSTAASMLSIGLAMLCR